MNNFMNIFAKLIEGDRQRMRRNAIDLQQERIQLPIPTTVVSSSSADDLLNNIIDSSISPAEDINDPEIGSPSPALSEVSQEDIGSIPLGVEETPGDFILNTDREKSPVEVPVPIPTESNIFSTIFETESNHDSILKVEQPPTQSLDVANVEESSTKPSSSEDVEKIIEAFRTKSLLSNVCMRSTSNFVTNVKSPKLSGLSIRRKKIGQRKTKSTLKILKQVEQNIRKYSLEDDEPTKGNIRSAGIATLRNVWNRIKGKHPSVLKGPALEIPKMTIISYFTNKIETNKLDLHRLAVQYDRVDAISFGKLHVGSYVLGQILIEIMEEKAQWSNHVPNEDLVIGLCVPNSHAMILCIFAIMKLGATYAPIDGHLPEERIKSILSELRPVLVIYSDEYKNLKNPIKTSITSFISLQEILKKFDLAEVKNEGEKQKSLLVTSDKLRLLPKTLRSLVVFTTFSTTGAVAPLRFSHGAVFNRLCWYWKTFPYEVNETVLLASQIHQINSVEEIFAPILNGITLVIVNHADLQHPFMISSKVQDFFITRLTISTTWLRAFLLCLEFSHNLMDWNTAFTTIKIWFFLGEPIDKELAEKFYKHCLNKIKRPEPLKPTLVNLLQTEENLGIMSYKIISDLRAIKNSIFGYVGRPLPNTVMYVVNDKFEIVRTGTLGEVFISSLQSCEVDPSHLYPLLAEFADDYKETSFFKNPFYKYHQRGPQIKNNYYWNRRFRKSFYCLQRTGCYGTVTSSSCKKHELMLESREPFQLFLDGSILDTREVGFRLGTFEEILSSHVVINNAGEPHQIVIAFCILNEKIRDAEQTEMVHNLRSRLKTILHPGMIPDIVFVDSFPKTVCGKVNENDLFRIYEMELKKRTQLTKSNLADLVRILKFKKAVKAAATFLPMVASILGISVGILIPGLYKPFIDFGGTITQSIYIVNQLHSCLYPIGLEEFLSSESLLHIVIIITRLENKDEVSSYMIEVEGRDEVYHVNLIRDFHKSEILRLLSEVFFHQGAIENAFGINNEELRRHWQNTWPIFTSENFFSFITVGKGGKFEKKSRNVGIIISVDSEKYLSQINTIEMSRPILYKLEMIENMISELYAREHGQQKLLQILYVGTSKKYLLSNERDEINASLVNHSLEVAKHFRFHAVIFPCFEDNLTTISLRCCGFKIIKKCQLNTFIASDGHRPFKKISDAYVATLCYKKIV